MTLIAQSAGFLGTGATLLADLTLIAYILLIMPAMLGGLWLVRRGLHRPHHKWLMVTVTVVNWLLIIFLMAAAFSGDVAPNLRENAAQPRYLVPGVHTLFGLPAQLLATFIVLRMLWEDWQVARARGRGETALERYWFKAAKWTMRLTLALWLITASLGVVSYLVRYNVIDTGDGTVPAPVATEEAGAIEDPVATEEVN